MDHDSRPSRLSSFPSLEMPFRKTSRTETGQRRRSGNSSRAVDPHDLSTRLTNVIAEREAAGSRSPSLENHRSTRTDSAAPGRKEGLSISRSRKATSAHARRAEEDDRRSCPMLSESLPTVSYGHRAGPGSSVRRASLAHGSGRLSTTAGQSHSATTANPMLDESSVRRASLAHGSGRPSTTAAQSHSATTANPMLNESLARQNSRRASSRQPEPTSPPRQHRRRSTLASQGSWDGMHEPTILEAVATDAKPDFRHTMFERHSSDKAQNDGARARRMTAGDVSKAQEAGDDAVASGDVAHYEIVNDHRVDWTQADEEAKMPRSKKLLRKADSILRLRRGSSARSAEGESSDGSVADGHEGGYSVSGGSQRSPRSPPRSPSVFKGRSLWPFKKQVAVESH